MSPVASWVFVALAVAPIVLCCWLLWPRHDSTGHRAGADLGDPDPQTGSDSPHGAAPVVHADCPDCGWPLALDFGRDLVCLRCASVWQREEVR